MATDLHFDANLRLSLLNECFHDQSCPLDYGEGGVLEQAEQSSPSRSYFFYKEKRDRYGGKAVVLLGMHRMMILPDTGYHFNLFPFLFPLPFVQLETPCKIGIA